MFAYVGSYTTPERKGHGNGINVYRVDPRSGAFRHIQTLGGLENPSFLAINAAGTRLYSVHGDRSEINAFTIDPEDGRIAPLNRQPTGGWNPVHLAFDAEERFLVVCNYGSDMPKYADETAKCPVLAQVGSADKSFPPDQVAAFQKRHPEVAFQIHPGAPHGFDNPMRPARYHAEACRNGRALTLEFLARHIG